MPDETIKELWRIKDSIAREHGYDVEALALYLRGRSASEDRRTVNLAAMRRGVKQAATASHR